MVARAVLIVALVAFVFCPADAMRRKRGHGSPGLTMNAFIQNTQSFMDVAHHHQVHQKAIEIGDAPGGPTRSRSGAGGGGGGLGRGGFGGMGGFGGNGTNTSMFADSLKLLFWSIDANHDEVVSNDECEIFSTHANCFCCLNHLYPDFFTTPWAICEIFGVTPDVDVSLAGYEEGVTDLNDLKAGKGGKGGKGDPTVGDPTVAAPDGGKGGKGEHRDSGEVSKGGKGGKDSFLDITPDECPEAQEVIAYQSTSVAAFVDFDRQDQDGDVKGEASLLQQRSAHESENRQTFEGSELDMAMGTKGCI